MPRIKATVLLLVLVGVTLSLPSNGYCAWPQGGAAVCMADSFQLAPAVVEGEPGVTIIAWVDRRSGASDIYAQQMDQ